MVSLTPKISVLFGYLLFGTANAFFKVSCPSPLVRERVDPLRSPGIAPSNHVHTVHGGSNFSPNSTFDTLRASSCTSCLITQDKSNYWFPTLYFQDPQTKKFEVVPNGGVLVYYLFRGNGDKSNGGPGLKAFPPGFKMSGGNPMSRSQKYPANAGSQAELAERSVKFTCLRYTEGVSGYNGYGFPTTNCESGYQARIHMPTCWDGVNLDSENHTSHVAYLSGLDNGKCPTTHPVYLTHLFYEVTWDVNSFASRWSPTTDKWPFTYATGDPTGFSSHADFQNGWDVDVLQNAIDYCDNPDDGTGSGHTEACTYLTLQTSAVAKTCKTNPILSEATDGTLNKLPGCNPLQLGPGDATIYSDANCPIV